MGGPSIFERGGGANILGPSLRVTVLQPLQAAGHGIGWDHFGILAKGKTDCHCGMDGTLFVRELERLSASLSGVGGWCFVGLFWFCSLLFSVCLIWVPVP